MVLELSGSASTLVSLVYVATLVALVYVVDISTVDRATL